MLSLRQRQQYLTRFGGSGNSTQCSTGLVWEVSGVIDRVMAANASNASSFGSCLAAKRPEGAALWGTLQPPRNGLLTYEVPCSSEHFALCMKPRGMRLMMPVNPNLSAPCCATCSRNGEMICQQEARSAESVREASCRDLLTGSPYPLRYLAWLRHSMFISWQGCAAQRM
jgi:hypothetical protein